METLEFIDHRLSLIDQTKLPQELVAFDCRCVDDVHDAIVRLVVRGAPAIGIAAGYGVCLACQPGESPSLERYDEAIQRLTRSRPTAVNLFWALGRMKVVLDEHPSSPQLADLLLKEAIGIHDEDRKMCKNIGRHGAELLRSRSCHRILTHCNAGGLATSMWGTALAPIYHLHEEGYKIEVYADETRPLLQGARLTAWELSRAGVPVTVLTDSMAGSLMKSQAIDAVIVGADRIAANGDIANKIGTYPLAILARYHNVPFYVAAPSSTFDFSINSGDDIPIEHRHRDEVAHPYGVPLVPEQANVINPAFDVTPADLITAIITEKGCIETPDSDSIASWRG